MSSDAHDPAVIEHHDLVGVDHGRQAVSDHDECAVLRHGVDRLAQQLLVQPVEG